jgi:type IV pilus assembly protein PilV
VTGINVKTNCSPVGGARLQRGVFLLEALIAILIVALGVLGSVGLLARSMQDVDDAKYRGEAALLAKPAARTDVGKRQDDCDSQRQFRQRRRRAGYTEWKTLVEQRLPNANLFPPTVTITPGPIAAPASNSYVTITIQWQIPSERTAVPPPPRRYDVVATVGGNL